MNILGPLLLICIFIKSAATLKSCTHPYNTLKIALSGGIAGFVGTASLFPLDTAKTIKQSNPSVHSNVFSAFRYKVSSDGPCSLYRGCMSASLTAIPSSALYFGFYEATKQMLKKTFINHNNNSKDNNISTPLSRLLLHSSAAAMGNCASSIIFVPKEYIKQTLQIQTKDSMHSITSVITSTLANQGVRGFYTGYFPTILRNVPGAIIRFSVYEELKIRSKSNSNSNSNSRNNSRNHFLAGALAGAVASGCTTPIDVIKTSVMTGVLPRDISIYSGAKLLVEKNGILGGLYAGGGARVLWSSIFGAVGFGTFELAKKKLGVIEDDERN